MAKNGPIEAQLFRDFYLGKFNKKTMVQEIHNFLDRPYKDLIKLKKIYRHVSNTKSQVENYRELGTGLENAEFKKLVKLDKPPN